MLAEADHQLALQPIRPRVRRTVYEIEITLANVLDLTDPDTLRTLDLDAGTLAADDMTACQQVGAATAWLEHDGLLVPSARSDATNPVLYAANRPPDARFDVIASSTVTD